jgi:hypothetical protein
VVHDESSDIRRGRQTITFSERAQGLSGLSFDSRLEQDPSFGRFATTFDSGHAIDLLSDHIFRWQDFAKRIIFQISALEAFERASWPPKEEEEPCGAPRQSHGRLTILSLSSIPSALQPYTEKNDHLFSRQLRVYDDNPHIYVQ